MGIEPQGKATSTCCPPLARGIGCGQLRSTGGKSGNGNVAGIDIWTIESPVDEIDFVETALRSRGTGADPRGPRSRPDEGRGQESLLPTCPFESYQAPNGVRQRSWTIHRGRRPGPIDLQDRITTSKGRRRSVARTVGADDDEDPLGPSPVVAAIAALVRPGNA